MMPRPRLFAELPAGLAAVSLALHGGPRCRPPISRMGNKAGYAHAILDALGLEYRQGADAYLWAEADRDVAALLRAYPDPEMLRRVADIIRGWSDEEPRALWERLRAERKARPPDAEPDVAGWLISSAWSYEQGNVRTGFCGPGERRQDTSAAAAAACKKLAEYAQIVASNRLIHVAGPELENTGKGGTTFGGDFATAPGDVAAGFERLAGWMWVVGNTIGNGVQGGFAARGIGTGPNRRPWMPAECANRCSTLVSSWPPVAVLTSIPPAAAVAEALGTPGDLADVVVYMDPPYVGTTGYGVNLSRAEVVGIALDYAGLGARVAVSESTAVAELVERGWYATDIGHTRRGQKRTFAANSGEVLTLSHSPHHIAPRPVPLFGDGACSGPR